MPLGIVNNQDFEKELTNSNPDYVQPRPPKPTIEAEIKELPTVGRTPEVPNVPQSLRKILGETHATEGLQAAKQLASSIRGISQPTLSAYGNGKVSPGKVNDDLINYLNERKTKISKRALNKINMALTLMDEEKMSEADAKELSSIAKDMSIVVKQMEPTERDDKKSEPVQFHFYAPQVKQENHYETVVAKDNY